MFRGDTISTWHKIDLSKVQMFFISMVLIVGYGAAIARFLDTPDVFSPFGTELPTFTGAMSTLLAISHAGYLAVKQADK